MKRILSLFALLQIFLLSGFATATTPVVFGTVVYSENGLNKGVYSFPAQSATELTFIYGDYNFSINGPAVRWNGNYYLFNGQDYGDGIAEVNVYVYDSDWEEIDELSFPATWYGTDLTVDPTTNNVYGVFASNSGSPELATIDINTEKRTTIGALSESIIALAADATGLLYGISQSGVLYRINKTDASLTKIGSTGVAPKYMQSATFDLATNRLFWATTTTQDKAGLYEVDIKTGAASLISPFSGNEEIVGLYTLSEPTTWTGGPDTPTAPVNLKLTYDNNVATLSWQAPAVGIHGENLDASSLTYSVTRYPDNVVVANGISETTYSETYVPEQLTAFYYKVVAHNGDLTGDEAQSNMIIAGEAVLPPYIQRFDDQATTSLMTTIDGDGDGSSWSFQDGKAFLWGAPFENTDDWLVTPALKLNSDYTYRLKVSTWCDWAGNYPYSVSAFVGQGNGIADLKQQLFSRININVPEKQQFDNLFSVEVSGNYFIGIRADGYDLSSINLDDLTLEQGPMLTAPQSVTDLTATADVEGKAHVTLTFTTPVLSLNKESLISLEKIKIYRDDALIDSLSDIIPGQQISYDDTEALTGQLNTYRVVAVNNNGEGQDAEITVWVGYDAPTSPINVALKEVGGKAVLTWDAPIVGQHQGPVDKNNLFYGVMRNDGQVVATGLQSQTYSEAIDNTGEQHWLAFGVQAANLLGYSEIVQSNGIIAGAHYELPFYEGFANGNLSNFWGSENYNDRGWGSSWAPNTDADADGNNGFIAFGTGGGYVGSGAKLFTGKINMHGAETPILEFYYSHRSENEYSELGSPLHVKIIKNGADTILVRDIQPIYFWQLDAEKMFSYECVDLAEFKDAEYIQVLFDAENSGTTYTYIDAVGVRNLLPNDLSVSLVSPNEATSGQNLKMTATVKNIGINEAGTYSVSLYDDGRLLETKNNTAPLGANAEETFNFSIPVNTLKSVLNLYATVDFDKDQESDNNRSKDVAVTVTLPIYPKPENVEAVMNNGLVSLTWQSPEYSEFSVPTIEDVENYEPYVVNTFGQWTTIDRDGLPTHDDVYAGDDHVIYDAAGQPTSWLVFNPVVRNYSTIDWMGNSNGWQPVSGNQFFAAVAVANGTSDDWLISPELTGEEQSISFYEHGYYNMETFEVLYSTTDTDPEHFESLAQETSSFDWTLRQYKLPAGAKYFAIRHTTSYGYRFFVDDIKFQSAAGKGSLKLSGYRIYCDGQLVGQVAADVTNYSDTNKNKGSHLYQVTAVYEQGESAASSANIEITTGISSLNGAKKDDLKIYGLDGRSHKSLQRGLNIVRTLGGTTVKVLR